MLGPIVTIVILLILSHADGCPTVNIENGYFQANQGYDIYSLGFTECNEGFARYGAKYSVCRKDGHWRPKPPKCYRMCKIPTDTRRASLFVQYRGHVEDTTEKVRHSLLIRIQCKMAEREDSHICKNGLWDGKPNNEIMCPSKNETPPADHEDQTLGETGSTTTLQTKGMNVTQNDADLNAHIGNPSLLRMYENKKNATDTMEASSMRTELNAHIGNPSPLRMYENKKNATDTMEASSMRSGPETWQIIPSILILSMRKII